MSRFETGWNAAELSGAGWNLGPSGGVAFGGIIEPRSIGISREIEMRIFRKKGAVK